MTCNRNQQTKNRCKDYQGWFISITHAFSNWEWQQRRYCLKLTYLVDGVNFSGDVFIAVHEHSHTFTADVFQLLLTLTQIVNWFLVVLLSLFQFRSNFLLPEETRTPQNWNHFYHNTLIKLVHQECLYMRAIRPCYPQANKNLASLAHYNMKLFDKNYMRYTEKTFKK